MAESFSAPDNTLKKQREEILGWAKQQLADFARSLNIQLSAKTIERVERHEASFARITFTRILRTVNGARENSKLPPILLQELFPTLTKTTGSLRQKKKK
jgi:hypothetical protein